MATHTELPPGFSPVPAGHLAAVVTHLEMTAPPASRPVPTLSRPLRLERMHDEDLAMYRALFREVGQEWLWFSRLRMPDAELARLLADPLVEAYAVRDGNARIGMLELDFREPGQCELAFFGLAASHVGQGAGRWLMHEATTRAWARGITRVHVHTCTLDHANAVAFYVRSGFTPYKREIEIAPDPRLTGELPLDVGTHAPVIRDERVAPDALAVVQEFWRLMATNDFAAVGAVLAPEFVLEWPQSRERIRGAANFAQMNAEYPAKGPWRFMVSRAVANGSEVVTDVSVTDGDVLGRAVSFFTVAQGRITRIVEFWPEPYPAPANRAHLVEPMA
ncbi:MAG: GNAT family N-acetyltransferase [Gemmatimonadaceae bacterium]|nr:GNAT family N-acetyltransferase [Gemmatimonadaceae bacterium]